MKPKDARSKIMERKIIIIGASSGIGARVALDFARVGFKVGIAARREDKLKEIQSQYPDRIFTKAIDITAEDAVARFYSLIEDMDGMDYLLLASGVGFQDPDLNMGFVERTLRTNVLGFARIMVAAFKYYRDTANITPGQIAAITSIAGTKGMGVAAAYSSSKRFQRTFIDALEQLAYSRQVNVRFTDIRPGFVDTDLLDHDKDYPMMMSINKVAPKIEEAILRRRRVVVIDSRWRVVNALWSLLPQCIWKHISLTL